MARIIYLENIKSFNHSVGSNGVCDLSGIVGNLSENNYLTLLDENRGTIKSSISENLGIGLILFTSNIILPHLFIIFRHFYFKLTAPESKIKEQVEHVVKFKLVLG